MGLCSGWVSSLLLSRLECEESLGSFIECETPCLSFFFCSSVQVKKSNIVRWRIIKHTRCKVGEVYITWKNNNNNNIRLAFACSASASFLACAFASAFLLLSSESLSTFCFLWISCCRFWSLISLAATKSVSPYVKYKQWILTASVAFRLIKDKTKNC